MGETNGTPSKLMTAFNSAVMGQVGSDRKHGWGVDDSCVVIESLIAEVLPEGETPSDEMMKLIKLVVNPSAFRQRLESAKRPDGQSVLAESKGKREKVTLALFT